jgi:phage protein D
MPAPSITIATMTIEVDGRPQPMLAAGLLAARMACGLDHAAEALLFLALPTPLDGEAAASVFEAVRLGRTLRLGLGEAVPALFSGEVVAVTQDLRADRAPRLEITAQDGLAALGGATVTRAYHDQTPLEVIRGVAVRHQLVLDGEIGDGGLREVIVQAGESDLAFVRRLALELDAGVVADEAGGLRLVRRGAAGAPRHRLVLGETLLALRLVASATLLPESLTVQGWDPQAQQPLTAVQVTPSVGARPPGTTSRGQVHLADPSLAQETAVAARLRALVADGNRRSVIATGTCSGAITLRPGDAVAVEGVGPEAAGSYLIERASHVFSLKGGWQTSFVASRPPPDSQEREAPNADRDPGNPDRVAPVRGPRGQPARPAPRIPGIRRRPGS